MTTQRQRNPDGTFAKKPVHYRKKTCPGCGQHLYLGQFYRRHDPKNFPDGYDCRCKQCRRKEKHEEYVRSRKVPDGIRLNANGQAVEHRGNSTRLYWGEQKIKDFRRIFPVNTNEDVAIDMGCSVRTVVRRAREMGLEKDPYWLQNVWNKNRKLAHGINKICGNSANLTNFIEGGKAHRFTSENHPSRSMTPEQRSAVVRKAWATRRRNKIITTVLSSKSAEQKK